MLERRLLALGLPSIFLLSYGCGDKDRAPVQDPNVQTGGEVSMGGDESGGAGGTGGGRIDNAFCEEDTGAFGGLGGGGEECSSSDGPTVDLYPPATGVRFDLNLDPSVLLQFDRPVCGAAENTVLIKRGGTGENLARDVEFLGDGRYEVTPHATDWMPFDVFDLVVRRGVTDVACEAPLAQEFGVSLLACAPHGWPTAGWPSEPHCEEPPDETLDQTYCEGPTEPLPLPFNCGRAAVEGTLIGTPPAADSSDPQLSELRAHTYELIPPVSGTYKVFLDGTATRAHTAGANETLTAEKVCDNHDCVELGSIVQLDVGSTCGDNDLAGYADFTGNCYLEEEIELTFNTPAYFTVRPDTDGGCGAGTEESCDYDYTLWILAPGEE